jgi:hypothetical protein
LVMLVVGDARIDATIGHARNAYLKNIGMATHARSLS